MPATDNAIGGGIMPKYRLMANYGFAGTETDLGIEEAEDEEQALDWAFSAATEQISVWVEEVEDDEEE